MSIGTKFPYQVESSRPWVDALAHCSGKRVSHHLPLIVEYLGNKVGTVPAQPVLRGNVPDVELKLQLGWRPLRRRNPARFKCRPKCLVERSERCRDKPDSSDSPIDVAALQHLRDLIKARRIRDLMNGFEECLLKL